MSLTSFFQQLLRIVLFSRNIYLELQKQNLALQTEIEQLHHLRDSLNSRLRAARARIEVLVGHLEQNATLNKLKDK